MNTSDFLDNRQIRIFISSTFMDMQEERRYLITKVFPALRHYCEEREVSLFELDLRWGISEEESKQGKVFDICLREVQRTKPFFIGLLGERYGWIPSEAERKSMASNTTVFKDFPWIENELADGTSITEIEMQEGVLRSKEKVNAYFYLRSQKMQTPAEFIEKEGSREAEKLAALKQALRGQDAYPVEEYDSVEQLGTLVENDFKALVNELFPQTSLTPLERERLWQRNFLKSRTRVYVPNREWDAKLDEFVESKERAIVIAGESGMGKSAFLANWASKRLERKNKNEKLIYHFIGATQSGGDYHKILQRLIDEVRDLYNIPANEEGAAAFEKNEGGKNAQDKQTEELQNLLFTHSRNGKLIIILEGMNRLSDTENAKLLNWLPAFPKNVKVIYSTEPGDTTMDALERRGFQRIDINAAPPESRKQLIKDYLKSFSKSLAPEQEERLAADEKSGNPLVLLSILDELRVYGVHEKLNEQIGYYLAAPDNESLFILILRHIEELFKDDKANNNLVKDILSLLAVSRYGLSETEILDISGASPLHWSQLFNAMAGQLAIMNGYVSFSNRLMQNAVEKFYLPDSESEKPYRSRIVSYMETNEQASFERKCDELPYQLFEMKEWDGLYNLLLDPKALAYIYQKDEYETGKYWRALHEADGKRYTLEKYFELENIISDIDALESCYQCITVLIHNVLNDSSLGLSFALRCGEICEEKYGKNHPSTASSYCNIGFFYQDMRNYQKALEYFQKSITIDEAVNGKKHPRNAFSYNGIGLCYSEIGEYQKALEYHEKALAVREEVSGGTINVTRETATSYNNIGLCYFYMGEEKKAIEYYEKAIAIGEMASGKKHPKNASSYNGIGLCYSNTGEYQKAIEYLRKALAIAEEAFGKNHPHTSSSYDSIGSCYSKMNEYKKAVEWYQRAAEQGNATAQNSLGNCYYRGEGVEQSYEKAVEWGRKAAEQGHADAQNNLGECYYRGKGVEPSYEKAVEWYRKAAEQGNAIAQNNLGDCYKNGKGVEQNYEKAFEWYQKAAWQGNARAQNSLGGCYYVGKGIEQSFEKAVEWCRKAAEQGDMSAQDNMGDCYYYGRGVEQNYEKAVEWYQKAAEQGVVWAQTQNKLGNCYYSGRGVEQNYEKAVEWYQKAAEQGNAEAQDNLGFCYRTGLGVEQNYEKALEWYQKALAIHESVFGKKHSKTTASYNNIGFYFSLTGSYEKAIEYYEKVIAVIESLGTAKFSNNVDTYFHEQEAVLGIAGCYSQAGDYKKAIEYYEKDLAVQAIHGKNSLETANTYSKIANCYYDLEEYKKALEYYEKTLAINEEALGKSHPDTATSYNSIGLCFYNLGEYKKALGYFEKTLAINEEALGESHPDTVSTYNDIGFCYNKMSEHKKAIEYYEKALAVRKKVWGENHPDTASSYSNIANRYYDLEEYKKALEYFENVLRIRETVLEKNHPNTVTACNNVGACYYKMGDYEKALEYHHKTLEARREIYGEEHDFTAFSYNMVAMDYEGLGNTEKALEYYNQALSIYTSLGDKTDADSIRQSIEKLQSKN